MGVARSTIFDLRQQTSRPRLQVRSLAYLAVAVAILCASSVFFILCQRDNSRFLAISNPLKTTAANASARPAISVTAPPLPAKPADSTAVLPQPTAPQRVLFRLRRSKSFQTVGPIKVRLLRINLRRSNADLSVMVNGRRFDRSHVALDRPLQVASSKGSGPSVELVLNAVTREGVSGYVTTSFAP